MASSINITSNPHSLRLYLPIYLKATVALAFSFFSLFYLWYFPIHSRYIVKLLCSRIFTSLPYVEECKEGRMCCYQLLRCCQSSLHWIMLLVFRHVPSAFRSSCTIYSLHGVNLRPEIEAWQSPKGIASLDLNLIARSEHSCFFSSPLQT
jgi:hypothetical protein